MLSIITRRPINFNKSLSDCCTRTTNESIKKITDKYNLERNKPKVINLLEEDNDNGNPGIIFCKFLFFLYTSYVVLFFLNKRIK